MNFHILTLFPGMFEGVFGESMLSRAKDAGILNFYLYNIRDFAGNKHNRVDDTPYGGGRGMVMQAPPVYDTYKCDLTFLQVLYRHQLPKTQSLQLWLHRHT